MADVPTVCVGVQACVCTLSDYCEVAFVQIHIRPVVPVLLACPSAALATFATLENA